MVIQDEKEIKEKLSILHKEINSLKLEARRLEDLERDIFIKKASRHIGRCFCANGVYYCVVGVPEVEHTLHGRVFNQCQYPVICIDTKDGYEKIKVSYDTIFSGVLGDVKMPHEERRVYHEVTMDEFLTAFNNETNRLRKIIVDSKKEIE